MKKLFLVFKPILSFLPVQLIIKKSLIIFFSVTYLILFQQIKSFASINESEIEDYGVISIMYHRFDESKYPSTNIQVDVFKKQLEIIQNEKIIFIQPSELKEQLSSNKNQRKILLTIDDGLLSFYNNAWPILKSKKIPFIIFVNTREVGSYNYMVQK